MSGFEVAQTVRSSPEEYGDNNYIVAVTANAMSGDREECLHAGMNDYLSKPFTIAQMRATLERSL
jgi:CheY-like chemotaxis protein